MTTENTKKAGGIHSITFNLIISFLIFNVIFFGVSLVQTYLNYNSQKEIISARVNIIAMEAITPVKQFIKEKFSMLETTANIGKLANTDAISQAQTLNELIAVEPSFRNVITLDLQKNEVAKASRLSTIATQKFLDKVKNEYSSELSLEQQYISSVYIDDVSSEPMVIMSVPINNVFGEPVGILASEVNLKFMWDLMGRIKVGKNGLAYVVNNQGTLIAFKDTSRVLKGENLTHLEGVKNFMNRETTQTANISKGMLGNDIVNTYLPLDTPDWAIVVELPVSEAFETIFASLKLSFLIIILTFLIGLALSIIIARTITKPIISLTKTTTEIAGGNFDVKTNIKSKNEIGYLATSFDSMVEVIKGTRDYLQSENAKLTEELKQAKEKK